MAAFMVYPTVIQDLAPSALRSRVASLSYLASIVFSSASPIAVGALFAVALGVEPLKRLVGRFVGTRLRTSP